MRLLLSLAVMFVACAPVPRPTPEVMPEVAAQFGEIVNDWDEERMLALFSAERRTRGSSAATFTRLHAQLGEFSALHLSQTPAARKQGQMLEIAGLNSPTI